MKFSPKTLAAAGVLIALGMTAAPAQARILSPKPVVAALMQAFIGPIIIKPGGWPGRP